MTDFFARLHPVRERLLRYGFEEKENKLVRSESILGGQFLLIVEILPGGEVRTLLKDVATDEPYTLHLVEEAEGSFVGSVREAYADALKNLAASCFERAVFRSPQTLRLLAHLQEAYGDEPEYLWERFPDNAVVRRKDNGKWYAAVLTAEKKAIGAEGEGRAEILDVRMDPAELDLLADGKKYFRGYHMNKRHWATVLLDDSLSDGEIGALVEESYHLAAK